MASHGVARTQRTRTSEQRLADLERIEEYRELENEIRAAAALKRFDSASLLQATSKFLRLNPEHYTVWNVRRRCLLTSGFSSRPSAGSSHSTVSSSSLPSDTTKTPSATSSKSPSEVTPPAPNPPATGSNGTTRDDATVTKDLDLVNQELYFTVPLLMDYPKCYWIWNYRRWILDQATERLPKANVQAIWELELGLVGQMLTRDRRNFHAWGYRRFVVAALEGLRGESMAEDELAYTEKMLRVSMSNFSAWHSRSQLIPRVLDERGADDRARADFLSKELKRVRNGLNVGPEDTSLWFYHQFLMTHVIQDKKPTVDGEGIKYFAPALTLDEKVLYIEREMDEIKDLLEDFSDVKYLYETLIDYTLALEKMGRGEAGVDRDDRLLEWLHMIQALDPTRDGRWKDLEARLGVSKV